MDKKLNRNKYKISSFITTRLERLFEHELTLENLFNVMIELNKNETNLVYYSGLKIKRSLTYKEMEKRSYGIASFLKTKLKQTNSRIILKCKNSSCFVELFWAILMSGNVPVLINALTSQNGVESIIKNSNSISIISDDEFDYSINTIHYKDIVEMEVSSSYIWANNVFFCSSGSTGEIKLLKFDGSNLCHQIASLKGIEEKTTDLIYPAELHQANLLLTLPLHHIYGFFASFLWSSFYGITIHIPSTFNIEELFKISRDSKITHIYGVPLFWDIVKEEIIKLKISSHIKNIDKIRDLEDCVLGSKKIPFKLKLLQKKIFNKLLGTNIKFIVSGGSYQSKETLYILNEIGYPLRCGYGMTEVGVPCFETSSNPIERIKGSIGSPLNNYDFKVGSFENKDELLIKGKVVCQSQIIHGVEEPVQLEKSYLKTADLVVEENGKYFLKGRIKEVVIKENGENVYPDEIEMLFQDLPFVLSLCVLGLAQTGSHNEKLVLVCQVQKELNDEEKDILIHAILNRCLSLPQGAQLDEVYVSQNKLPSPNGIKVSRKLLRELILKKDTSLSLLELKDDMYIFSFSEEENTKFVVPLKQIFARVLNKDIDQIDCKSRFIYDLGGDSLRYLEVVSSIEKTFNVSIKEDQFFQYQTIASFVNFLRENKSN